jgi:hypothetical protein
MENKKPRVVIVIIDYNNWPDTEECLGSFRTLKYANYEVVLIDNGSTGYSVAHIDWPFKLTYIHNNMNLGYSGGNNVGIKYAISQNADYIWFLNNDTVVHKDSLVLIVGMADKNTNCDFFGSWIVSYDNPDIITFGGGTYRWLTGYIAHDLCGRNINECQGRGETNMTDWVTGCSLLVRAKAIEQIGFMDSNFFLYMEELEWQLRLNKRHPKGMILKLPLVLHKSGRSTGTIKSYLGALFMSRNYLKLIRIHAKIAAPIWFIRWLLKYLIYPFIRGEKHIIRATSHSLKMINVPGDQILKKVCLNNR